MASRRSHSTADLALRRRGGLHLTHDKEVEGTMATMGKEHDRAERRLGAALAEQRRSRERYDAAVGRSAHPCGTASWS